MNPKGSRWAFGALIALVLAGCGNVIVEQQSNGSPLDKQATWTPPSKIDFPEAPQTLVFSGELAAQVSTAQPTSCAWGTGPGGPIYAYAAYFNAGGGQFFFEVSTDPKVERYKGPGTYHPNAMLDFAERQGTTQPHYQGRVSFVVTHDPLTGRVPQGPKSPNTGTVDGTLTDSQGRMVSVSGGWTCVPSMFTGPG